MFAYQTKESKERFQKINLGFVIYKKQNNKFKFHAVDHLFHNDIDLQNLTNT